MPRCGCADSCSCLVVAGDGISVEGIGTLENPYQITSESADLTGRLVFLDEGNVDFTVTGVGTLNDPTAVTADAVLALGDLTDVPDTTPAAGDILVWHTDHWEYEQPSGGGGGGSGVPPGGLTGEVLTKLSDLDGDADWEPVAPMIGERTYTSLRRHAAATSIPNAAWTRISLDTPAYEDGVPWDGNAFTVPVAGYYQVDAAIAFSPNATNVRGIGIFLNGVQFTNSSENNSGASAVPGLNSSITVKCAAGDAIDVRAYQNSGAALVLQPGATNNWLSVAKVPAPAVSGAAASGVWGVAPLDKYGANSLVGRPIYVDSAGQLRGQPSDGGKPFCAATANAAQSMVSGSEVPIVYQTSVVSQAGMFTNGGSVITIPEDGLYELIFGYSWAPNATGSRILVPKVNGVSAHTGWNVGGAGLAASISGTMTLIRSLAAGNTVSMSQYQSSGATLPTFSQAYPSLTVSRLGPPL